MDIIARLGISDHIVGNHGGPCMLYPMARIVRAAPFATAGDAVTGCFRFPGILQARETGRPEGEVTRHPSGDSLANYGGL